MQHSYKKSVVFLTAWHQVSQFSGHQRQRPEFIMNVPTWYKSKILPIFFFTIYFCENFGYFIILVLRLSLATQWSKCLLTFGRISDGTEYIIISYLYLSNNSLWLCGRDYRNKEIPIDHLRNSVEESAIHLELV